MEKSHKQFDDLRGQDIAGFVSMNANSLTFPEKLMYLITSLEQDQGRLGKYPLYAPIAWDSHGKIIIIHNEEELLKTWLPRFSLGRAKFSSFTRKLYRWGFRRVTADWQTPLDLQRETSRTGQDTNLLCFHHSLFQRDDKQRIYQMESLTPAKMRRKKANEYNRILRQKEQEAANTPLLSHLHASVLALADTGISMMTSTPPTQQRWPLSHPTLSTTQQLSGNPVPDSAGRMLEMQHNFLACQYLLDFSHPSVASATASLGNSAHSGSRFDSQQTPEQSSDEITRGQRTLFTAANDVHRLEAARDVVGLDYTHLTSRSMPATASVASVAYNDEGTNDEDRKLSPSELHR